MRWGVLAGIPSVVGVGYFLELHNLTKVKNKTFFQNNYFIFKMLSKLYF